MSARFYVFLMDDRLPTRDEWQSSIDNLGVDLKLDKFSPREHSGFLPAPLNGRDSGFEYSLGAAREYLEDEDDGEFLAAIGNRDLVVSFILHGGREDDYEAARYAAAALTIRTSGVFSDPQSGEYAGPEDVLDLLEPMREIPAEVLEMRRQEAEKDATLTARRCPRCGSPCPTYRKTCRVCEYPIGRK